MQLRHLRHVLQSPQNFRLHIAGGAYLAVETRVFVVLFLDFDCHQLSGIDILPDVHNSERPRRYSLLRDELVVYKLDCCAVLITHCIINEGEASLGFDDHGQQHSHHREQACECSKEVPASTKALKKGPAASKEAWPSATGSEASAAPEGDPRASRRESFVAYNQAGQVF